MYETERNDQLGIPTLGIVPANAIIWSISFSQELNTMHSVALAFTTLLGIFLGGLPYFTQPNVIYDLR